MNERIHFLHHSPGRLRIQIDGLKGNAKLADAIQSLTDTLPGGAQITASTVTGSVLIRYDSSDSQVLQRLESLVADAEALLSLSVTDPRGFAQRLRAWRITQ